MQTLATKIRLAHSKADYGSIPEAAYRSAYEADTFNSHHAPVAGGKRNELDEEKSIADLTGHGSSVPK